VRVALLFTDGVGIGRRAPAENPLARAEYLLSQFEDGSGTPLPPGTRLHPLDTTFGIPGRPQSASNQSAIFTGEPAPALIGRHVLGFPNAPLRGLLAERSIVKRLVDAGRTATFANAYPVGYLDALGLKRRPGPPDIELPPRAVRKLRPSASTCAMAAGGIALRTLEDARRGEGLTHDVDGTRARARGLDVPARSAAEAAQVFWRIAQGNDFTLFEHYLADEAGHARDFESAAAALQSFDAFARHVIAARPEDAQVLICSDHGNVEDLRTRGHTRNPVAGLSCGPARWEGPTNVADVGKAVLALNGVTP
jgi:hypothetical protein